ncbi:maleylpyruvate isomerase family mycothiol-dependent enzyme [Actinokineospora enzanensis]|uniref:maleylpyruvate isomerase family mycothiol-dependent enzyme n=1 Tax=Actinokineospora enzanensis TaxID=155975 RepID=UPI0003778786|nr:maleylpyruvate isomerase family mycothiol-dependent enzyme [Actinokineospora enzanensis]
MVAYLEHLAAESGRLRAAAAGALDEQVPTCPGWTGADLLLHVAEVYLHKARTMAAGEWPQPWPPDFTGADPVETFDAAYAELIGQLEPRPFADSTLTWYPADQTVGFWARRMAQEAVIHRIDAESAAGLPSAEIPVELALDGVDEVLTCFLSFASTAFPQAFSGALDGLDGRVVRVEAGPSSWYVTLSPTITVSAGGTSDAVVRGEPGDVLRWLWRRADDSVVAIDGDAELVHTLYGLLKTATQ